MEMNELVEFLEKVPDISFIENGANTDGKWWIKFKIDINHSLAWHVVQELGYILNYISIEDRLPTKFIPVSPPPYMNGGPKEYLSWIIESTESDVDPNYIADTLIGRMPDPVDDLTQWHDDE